MSLNSPFATCVAKTVDGTVVLYHLSGENWEVDRISPGVFNLHELCTNQFSLSFTRFLVWPRPGVVHTSTKRDVIMKQAVLQATEPLAVIVPPLPSIDHFRPSEPGRLRAGFADLGASRVFPSTHRNLPALSERPRSRDELSRTSRAFSGLFRTTIQLGLSETCSKGSVAPRETG